VRILPPQKRYQVYALTSEMNEVRQYVDPKGVVFGIGWLRLPQLGLRLV